MLEWVQAGTARGIERYLSPHEDDLDPIVDVTTLDPRRLLAFAASGKPGKIGDRTRFECLRGFDIGCGLVLDELNAPQEFIGEERDKFVDLLASSMFRPGEEIVVPVYSYHRPTMGYAVDMIGFGKDTHPHSRYKRMKAYTCRVLTDGSPVFFHHRVKKRFDIYLKRLRQLAYGKKSDPFTVLDVVGVTFFVENQAVARRLIKQLTETVVGAGGRLVYRENNMTANGHGRMDKDNPISSPRFHAAKFEVWLNGRCYEVLVMTFRDMISAKYALTRENHELYRLTQWYELFAPILFPEAIYGIAWRHKRIQKALKECKMNELGWHANCHDD